MAVVRGLSRNVRGGSGVDTSSQEGVSSASRRIPSRVVTANEGTWFFPPSVSQADRQRYLDASMPQTPATPASTGTFGGYTQRDADRFVQAVRAGAPTPAPTSGVPTAQTGGGFGGYTQTDADRFAAAIRGGTNQGAAFGGGYDPLRTPTRTSAGQDALWEQWKTQQFLKQLQGQQGQPAVAGGGDGGAAAANARALQAYRDYVTGETANVNQVYGDYLSQLASAEGAAREMIGGESARTVAALEAMDPMAQFQFQMPPTVQPTAASADYLRAIGASTRDVDAAQMLGQQMMMQQLGSAEQFAGANAEALARDREARLAAARMIEQQALSGLASQGMGLRASIGASQAEELRALQQALMEAQLKYGV